MSYPKSRLFLVVLVSLFLTSALFAQGGAGSKGRLEIKGIKGSDIVYLNGRGPDFRIGTVEETRTKDLILPPGQQHVILVDPNGEKQVYSAYVIIKDGQKATLHVDKSDTFYEQWAGDPGMPRMGPYATEGSAGGGYDSATPVSYKVVAPKMVPCGDKAEIKLSGPPGYAYMKSLTNEQLAGPLDPNGLVPFDPGLNGASFRVEWVSRWGVYLSDPQTIAVDRDPHVTLASSGSGPYVYHRVGERVVEDPTVNLHWTAKNATSVQMINPQGEVIKVPITGAEGEVPVKFVPGDYDPEKRAINYKIQGSNPCTGAVETATVHWDPTFDQEVVAQALPPVLPHTGSPLPLIALLGFGSVVSGLALRMFRKR